LLWAGADTGGEPGLRCHQRVSETNGDVLDLRAALKATSWNDSASTLGNSLTVTDSGGNTTLSVAATGSGAGTAIATLNGVRYGLSDLLSHTRC
jgi:large repetitive protein